MEQKQPTRDETNPEVEEDELSDDELGETACGDATHKKEV
jgi:hypothetical protein